MQSWKNFIFRAGGMLVFLLILIIPLLGQNTDTRNRYNEKLNHAEKLFFEKKYPEAKKAFEGARQLIPSETHPANRIREINKILGIEDEPNAEFLAAAQKADRLFDGQKWEEALDAYIAANDIMPDQERITDRILELHELIREKQARENSFNLAMQRGNQLLAGRQLEKAREEFEKALNINPGSSEARSQLADISKTLNEIKQYQEAVEVADSLYMDQDYEGARTAYQQALNIQPNQAYPKNMILRIDELIIKSKQDELALQQAYSEAIENGDDHFEAKDYATAKLFFEQAAELMPAQSYPRAKITEINNLLADLEILELQYLQTITEADGLFENQEHKIAIEAYRRALALKPGEKYPQERIDEISILLTGKLDDAYQSAIALADELFQQENWELAKAEYQIAAGLKPDEEYPKRQIISIENLLAGLAEADAAYQSAIDLADQFYQQENWELAKTEYQKATDLKPEEEYPKSQIIAIENFLVGLAEADAAYQSAIALADGLFQQENWEQAKAEYQKAAGLKPEEEYPKSQITTIENLLAGLAEANAAHQSAIALADELFQQENWEQAKMEYQKATGLKPEEEYPKSQIIAIENFLAGLAEADAAYQSAIALADELFQQENWEQAKAEYQKAADLKQEEEYPKSQIIAIENLLAGLAQTDAAYQSAIQAADRFFAEFSYEQARTDYEIAATLKPEEEYPNSRIAEIDLLLAGIAEKQAQYDSFITSADFHYDAGNLHEAKNAYSEAVQIFPNIAYAQGRLKAIEDELRAERERVMKEYNAIIAEADRYFNQRAYDNAINQYMIAADILPDEDYPKKRIEEITKIIEANVVVDVITGTEVVESNVVSKFNFDPVPRQGRRESYIIVKARNMSERDFRVFLNYGKDGTNNGGFVINIPNISQPRDYIVKVGSQYRWFSEDNNWISLQPEGGSVEVSMIQISQE